MNFSQINWPGIAVSAIRSPGRSVPCPLCRSESMSGAWNLVDVISGEVLVDLNCSACQAAERVRVVLPKGGKEKGTFWFLVPPNRPLWGQERPK
jgi:hypothetical protein